MALVGHIEETNLGSARRLPAMGGKELEKS